MKNTSKRGLGSDNMDDAMKREIQSKGGKKTGAKNLDTAARSKGGKRSHGGGRQSD
jgi:general stress protein YciG